MYRLCNEEGLGGLNGKVEDGDSWFIERSGFAQPGLTRSERWTSWRTSSATTDTPDR